MDLQKINVKLFVAGSAPASLEPLIAVFNSWIQAADGEYYDLADYAHVPAGPGVVLVAHDANISMDNSGNRLGLLYSRKQPLAGTNGEKLSAAFASALEYCGRIESEPALEGRFRFAGGEALVVVNDRLAAPNTEETFAAVKPEVEALAWALYAGSEFSLEREPDRRRRFGVHLKPQAPFDITTLLKNIKTNLS